MTTASVCASPCDAMKMGSVSCGPDANCASGRNHEVGPYDAPHDAFARLAGLVTSNDRYLGELRALNARVASAKAHLATNPPDLTLGQAYLDRARASRSRVLTLLRANRIAAREFLCR